MSNSELRTDRLVIENAEQKIIAVLEADDEGYPVLEMMDPQNGAVMIHIAISAGKYPHTPVQAQVMAFSPGEENGVTISADVEGSSVEVLHDHCNAIALCNASPKHALVMNYADGSGLRFDEDGLQMIKGSSASTDTTK